MEKGDGNMDNVKIINDGVNDFRYTTEGSSCFDIRANHNAIVPAGDVKLVKTGFKLEMPVGYELQIRSRSGLALNKKISVLNSPGTVDSDYRGEVGVILMNNSKEDFEISIGDRIAQGAFCKIEKPFKEIFVTMSASEGLTTTERGEGGFGHTGKN